MFRPGKTLLVAIGIILICAPSAHPEANSPMRGTVVGRTDGGLQISVPQPVREGTSFVIKLLPRSPVIAEAKTVSCTTAWPFTATATIVRGDIQSPVPIGADAYADLRSVDKAEAPKPVTPKHESDGARVSVQAGAFYPDAPALRSSLGEYWNAYRLNYSFLKVRNFEGLLSAEYAKGSGQVSSDLGLADRTMELLPVTILGKLRPIRIGDASLFVGGGGGMYFTRTKDDLGLTSTTVTDQHPGYEFAAGLESRHGWILEMRYRSITETDLAGYSLAAGAKF